MIRRQEFLWLFGTSIVVSTVLGVGIMVWGWSPVLIFAVPFFGTPFLVGWLKWLESDTRARRKRERLQRRHHRAVGAH